MAVKIAGKLRGENADEQMRLEKKRFEARQKRRTKLAYEKDNLPKDKGLDIAPYPIE